MSEKLFARLARAARVSSPMSTALAFPPATTVTSSMPITLRMSRR